MTDKQLREFVQKKTIDELMMMLVNYGKALETCENMKVDLSKFDTLDRLIGFVKNEIRKRAVLDF